MCKYGNICFGKVMRGTLVQTGFISKQILNMCSSACISVWPNYVIQKNQFRLDFSLCSDNIMIKKRNENFSLSNVYLHLKAVGLGNYKNTLMKIKGFSQCIAANKQQACCLAAAASCCMVAACEF